MKCLFDAGVLIRLAGNLPDWLEPLTAQQESCAVSVVTLDELLRTVHPESLSAGARARRLAFVEGVARQFEIVPVDEAVVRVHATLVERWEGPHAEMSVHAGWIAATCLAYSLSLVTDRPAIFDPVQGLSLNRVGVDGDQL